MPGKYFIFYHDRLYTATAENFLMLISDKNPEIEQKLTKLDSRMTLFYTSDDYNYNLVIQDVITSQFAEHISSLLNHVDRKFDKTSDNYENFLDSLSLNSRHLSDKNIKSILEKIIESIEFLDEDKVDNLLDKINKDLKLYNTIKKANSDKIYQENRQKFIYKYILSSLEGEKLFFHHQLENSGNRSYYLNHNINENIQDHINAKNIEYEISQVKLEFYKKLLEEVIIFHSEKKLYKHLRNNFQKEKWFEVIEKTHNNSNMTDNEKIFMFFSTLYSNKTDEKIGKFLEDYFHFSKKYFVYYLKTLLDENDLGKEYNNIAQAILQYFAEKPLLYKAIQNYMQSNKSSASTLSNLCLAAGRLLEKTKTFQFFFADEKLKNEISVEADFLKELNCFVKGDISIAELKEIVTSHVLNAYLSTTR